MTTIGGHRGTGLRDPAGLGARRPAGSSDSGPAIHARDLSCPSCNAAFFVRSGSEPRSRRCVVCRAVVSGDGAGPVQWLYPRRAAAGSAQNTMASFDGSATSDMESGPAADLAPRTIGRYELGGLLGRGGMGAVYEAWDPVLQRGVALKVLLAGAFASEAARARFAGEARAAAGLRHEGIVGVLDVGTVDEQPWFAMERVDGPSLAEVLEVTGPLPLDEVARIGAAVARAVAAAHEAGIAHRDLKPANVLLDTDGAPRVTDFGLAKFTDDEGGLTASHQALGTPRFMAPEVARGPSAIDWMRVDIFGVGAILHAVLTGKPPVDGATVHAILAAAAAGERRPLRSLRADVPPALEAVVDKALAAEPDRRYPTALELALDLERWREGLPVTARPESALDRGRRWARRRRAPLIAGTLAAVGVAAAAGIAPIRDRLAQDRVEASALAAWTRLGSDLADHPDDAEAAIRAFTAVPEHEATQAAAQAWLRLGDIQYARPRPRGELGPRAQEFVDAWARALTEAATGPTRAEALIRLASDAASRWAVDDLQVLCASLADLPGDRVDRRSLLPLLLVHAELQGDRAAAVAAWDEAASLGLDVANAWADPRRFDPWRSATEALPFDHVFIPDPSVVPEPAAIVLDDADARLIALRPGYPELARAPIPGVRDPAFWTWRDAQPVALPGRAWTFDWYDLDGDSVIEGYGASGRRTVRAVPRDGGYDLEPFLPDLDRIASDVGRAEIADLDLDGVPEIAIGVGPWIAYDLRVYAPGAPPTLRARAARNATQFVASMKDPWRPGRLLVSSEYDTFSNAVRHGVAEPDGPPSAILVRRLVGDTLEDVASWPLPDRSQAWSLMVGDLDADGRDDIVGSVRHPGGEALVVLWSRDDTEGFSATIVPGYHLDLVAQLDDDPALELVVSVPVPAGGRREPRILGRGSEPMPAPAAAAPRGGLSVPPGALDGPMARVWEDARLLAGSGLPRLAAELLQRTATLRGDGDMAAAAAALWDEGDRPADAALALEQVASSADGRAGADAAWEGAVRRWLAAARPEQALAAAARWRRAGSGPTGALAAELGEWEAAASHVVRWSALGLPGATWSADEPLAFRQVDGETWVDALGGDDVVLAHATVVPTGGPVAVMFDLDVERQEWGVGFHLVVGPERGSARVGVGTTGAEMAQQLVLRCDGASSTLASLTRPPFPGPAPRVRVQARLTWDPADPRWRCDLSFPQHDAARVRGQGPPAPPGERVDLRLVASGQRGAWLSARVERLEVWGVDPAPAATTPELEAAAALLRGDPNAALAVLPADRVVDRAVALAALRRPFDAVSALRAALDDPALAARLPWLLRARREVFAPLVREAAGARFPGLFWSVYAPALHANHAAPWIDEAMRDELEGIELPPDPDAAIWPLLAWRAIMLLRAPDPQRGIEAAGAWLARYDTLTAEARPPARVSAVRLRRELAFAAARAGDADQALPLAQRAVMEDPRGAASVDLFRAAPEWQAAGLPLPVWTAGSGPDPR